jgi:integrase
MKFNEAIWNPSLLRLTEPQLPAFETLKTIIASNESRIATMLRDGEEASWVPDEIHELQDAVTSQASVEWSRKRTISAEAWSEEALANELKCIQDCLAKVTELIVRNIGKDVPRPRSVHRIGLETNPFRDGLMDAELTFRALQSLVKTRLKKKPTEQREIIALALLSSIAQFQLLDTAFQVAWFMALADERENILRLGNQHMCIQLHATWGDQSNAERRLYIPDRQTGLLVSKILDHKVEDILPYDIKFQQMSPKQRQKAIHKSLQNLVDEFIARHYTGKIRLTLPGVTDASRLLAYLHTPSAIAAHRRRKTISHAPRMAILKRIFAGAPVSHDETRSEPAKGSTEEISAVEEEVADDTEAVPRWYVEMRQAFRLEKGTQITAELARIACSSGPMGSCMARFAAHLVEKRTVSTAERLGLLIGRRLGCRQDGRGEFDPAKITVAELESLYGEILEDDWGGVTVETQEEQVRRDKTMTVRAIVRFHAFLQSTYRVGELDEMKDRLHAQGLLPVDANFLTLDEYSRILRWFDSDTSLNDPHKRKAYRLFVSLCFWCGLRRDEAFGLRVRDLDGAGYLHVRPYTGHELKTSNANRSIPASLLMPREIFTELTSWAEQRAKASRGGAEVLFFSQPNDASTLLPSRLLFDRITKSMRESLGDQSLKIHHLRHSFATLLTAKLLPHMQEFASVLFARHPETLEWLNAGEDFRTKLFGTNLFRSADLQAIAHLLGHGSPGISVEHYIHCLDWCRPIE